MAKVDATCCMCKEKFKRDKDNPQYKVSFGKKNRYFCSKECQDNFNKGIGIDQTLAYDILLDYIKNLYVEKNPDMVVMAFKLHQLQDNFGFKPMGMKITLEYYLDILDNTFREEFDVKWIIEKYYEEAKDFYIQSNERKKALESIEQEQVITCRCNDKQRSMAQFKAKIKGVME